MALLALTIVLTGTLGMPVLGRIPAFWPTDLPRGGIALPAVAAPARDDPDTLFGRVDGRSDSGDARALLLRSVYGIVVPLGQHMAIGTGVLHQGHIFTNFHVVQSALADDRTQSQPIQLFELAGRTHVADLTLAALPDGAAGGTTRDVAVLRIENPAPGWDWLATSPGLPFAPNASASMLGVYASFAVGGTSGSPLIDQQGRIVALTSEGGHLRHPEPLETARARRVGTEEQLLRTPVVAVRRSVVPQSIPELAPFITTEGEPISRRDAHLVVNLGWPAGIPAWSHDVLLAAKDAYPTSRLLFLEPWARAVRQRLGLEEALTPDRVAERAAVTSALLASMRLPVDQVNIQGDATNPPAAMARP